MNADDENKLPTGTNNDNSWWTDYHGEKSPTDKKFCLHKWVKYKGFNEDYWFCEKCDEKKPLQEDEV